MRQGWFCGKEKRTGKTMVASTLMVLLLIVIGFTTLPRVNAQTPAVTEIISGGRSLTADTISLTDPTGVPCAVGTCNTYDPSTGSLGPFVVDNPVNPAYRQTNAQTYTITITWAGAYDPVLVGGFCDFAAPAFFWSVTGTTLTITAQSVRVDDPVLGTVYFLSVQVFFQESRFGENYGVAVCIKAENIDVAEGERPGILVITVTGYPGQVDGFVKLFIPAWVPEQFGRTLDDVLITVDGSAVVGATTTDTSSIVNDADGLGALPGRLWEFTVFFSERTIKSDPDPPAVPVGGHPVSVNKLAITAPYLALAALVVLVSTVFAMRRRRL